MYGVDFEPFGKRTSTVTGTPLFRQRVRDDSTLQSCLDVPSIEISTVSPFEVTITSFWEVRVDRTELTSIRRTPPGLIASSLHPRPQSPMATPSMEHLPVSRQYGVSSNARGHTGQSEEEHPNPMRPTTSGPQVRDNHRCRIKVLLRRFTVAPRVEDRLSRRPARETRSSRRRASRLAPGRPPFPDPPHGVGSSR